MPAPRCRLDLIGFGPPTALVDGRAAPPEVLWRKHLAVLVYLALSPSRRRTRDHLLGVLWPERPQAEARHSLNQAVLRLRRAPGEDRLRSEADALALSEDGLGVDALRLAAAEASEGEDVVALLKGDFLEGFHLDAAPEFDDWMARERERYRTLTAAALVAAGERRPAGPRFSGAPSPPRPAPAPPPHRPAAAPPPLRPAGPARASPPAVAGVPHSGSAAAAWSRAGPGLRARPRRCARSPGVVASGARGPLSAARTSGGG